MPDPDIYFKQVQLGPMQNFVYLIGDPQTRQAAVVDPGWEPDKILKQLDDDGYSLSKIFLTHTHPDHWMGLHGLLGETDVPVYVHAEESDELDVSRANLKPTSGGETVSVGQVPVQLIHTPGHTPGSQCLLARGRLLSGDTLFIKGCGRCDLPGGDAATLYDSLMRLRQLDDTIVLYPGHDYADVPAIALGEEKRSSPFLKMPTLEDFLRLLGHA